MKVGSLERTVTMSYVRLFRAFMSAIPMQRSDLRDMLRCLTQTVAAMWTVRQTSAQSRSITHSTDTLASQNIPDHASVLIMRAR